MSFILRNTSDKESSPNYLLQFDGGANPNPGPCAGAYIISKIDTQDVLFEGGTFINQGTNNVGEYMGLLGGLKVCKENHLDNILIQGDSKLVVYQVSNKWKINYDHIRKLYNEIQDLLKHFVSVSIRHVYREENNRADELSDETLDKKSNWIRF
jgi:ribonuclease HI